MLRRLLPITLFLVLAACGGGSETVSPTPLPPDPYANPRINVVADGLLAPIGLAVLADGSLLVAEDGTGQRDDSAGVSLIKPDGRVGRLISGLPSTHDSGDLAGSPLVALSPAGDKIYLGAFDQHNLWTLLLTPEQQVEGIELPAQALTTDDLTPEMLPLNQVMVMNPFDMTFDSEGRPVVTDSTGDGVAKETPDGRTYFIHRFAPHPAPTSDKPKMKVSPVPTGIERIGDEYYVTLTGGCPFPPGGGRLVAIDEERNERVVADSLNMPIDVAQGPDGTIWLLEFALFAPDAGCFSGTGYRERTGTLSRLLPDGTLEPVLSNLNTPGSVLPLDDGSLLLTEVFPGRVLRVTFGDDVEAEKEETKERNTERTYGQRNEINPDDYDQLQREVIEAHDLKPQPGADQREGDTRLAALGQALFFDPILSGDHNTSCATCHHPTLAGADGLALPIGTGGFGLGPQRLFLDQVVLGPEASQPRRLAGLTDPITGETSVANPFAGQFVPRNSPTIINSALFPTQFWDSRVEAGADGESVRTPEDEINRLDLTDPLAVQALFPLTSLHEMAGGTLGDQAPQAIRRQLLDRLRGIPAYESWFAEVFATDNAGGTISLSRLAEAIAAFERRFIFTDAPFDGYLAGDTTALSEQQKRGALLFFGQIIPEVNCSLCHSGNLFSDFRHRNLLVPQLGPGKGHDYSGREDWGRAGISFDARDRYTFRTPSLRNVELTAPYFHDGAYATLVDVIGHHADIWGSAESYDPVANDIPPALFSSLRPFQPDKQGVNAAPVLRNGLPLTEEDKEDLAVFLQSLTDPDARDLSEFLPEGVPSGLPLDQISSSQTLADSTHRDSDGQMAARGDQAISDAEPQSTGGSPPTISPLPGLSDVAAEVGLDFQHGAFRKTIFQDPVAAMSGGLCWIDYDNDGWLDLYLVNSYAEDEKKYWQDLGGLPHNALYRNSSGTFSDVSAESGTDLVMRGNGCVAADFDGDGWWDLYVTADGPNALLWNNGDGTFAEGAAAAGVDAPEWNSAAVVGDVNRDSLPDLFVAAFIDLDHQIPKPIGAFPQDYYGLPDRLYLNQGAGSQTGASEKTVGVQFREVALQAGLERQERGLGALLSDLDRDGELDLFIANDGHPNRLYTNEPWPGGVEADPLGLGFRFRDLTETANVGDSGSGMGVAAGDYDGDGWTDLFTTNWERELNALYRNETGEQGSLTFQYSTFRIGLQGLGNNMTGWGTHWLDLDQDTDLDLLVVNGRVPVTSLKSDPQLVRLYANRIADGARSRPGPPRLFVDATQQAGLEEVGPLLARGSAVADFDNDGDLDVAINVIGGEVALLRNEGPANNWLQVALDGFWPGAVVVAELPDGRRLVRELHVGSSYLASEDPRLHFGVGTADRIPRLEVRLPDGRYLEFSDVPANQVLAVSP
ncbi:MAG: ScyD/ScyE family protein [Chloroflexota bacterium]|nr:ScyD/ScyE family protein [Chloroflexota bacterium]